MSFFDIKKHIRGAKEVYGRLGPKKILKASLHHCSERLLLSRDLPENEGLTVQQKLEVRRLKREELSALSAFCEPYKLYGRTPAEEFTDYLQNGSQCLIAKDGDDIVGFLWWGNKDMKFNFHNPDLSSMGESIKLPDDGVCAFDIFIAPQYRKGGNGLEFLQKMPSALKGFGYDRVFCFVKKENFGARWLYSLVGLKEIRRILTHRVFLFFIIREGRLSFDRDGYKWLRTSV